MSSFFLPGQPTSRRTPRRAGRPARSAGSRAARPAFRASVTTMRRIMGQPCRARTVPGAPHRGLPLATPLLRLRSARADATIAKVGPACQRGEPAQMAVADTFDKLIGERIRARRTELGLTQEQRAVGLDVSYQQIPKYESGASRIAASRLVALAARLEAPVTYFLGGQGSESGPRQRTALELA